jgi:hypothetical protein
MDIVVNWDNFLINIPKGDDCIIVIYVENDFNKLQYFIHSLNTEKAQFSAAPILRAKAIHPLESDYTRGPGVKMELLSLGPESGVCIIRLS